MARETKLTYYQTSWEDVALSIEEHEKEYNCELVITLRAYRPFASANRPVISVGAYAITSVRSQFGTRGMADAVVGSSRGGKTVPSTVLRCLVRACEDLARNRTSPKLARESVQAVLPWDKAGNDSTV